MGGRAFKKVNDARKTPGAEEWISIPEQQLAELNFLKTTTTLNWTGISPANQYVDGPASDTILYGDDDLLFNDSGESIVTTGTMAQVIVKEILHPTHQRSRMTVANS